MGRWIGKSNRRKIGSSKTKPLSSISSVVRGLNTVKQKRIYVALEKKDEAEAVLKKIFGGD